MKKYRLKDSSKSEPTKLTKESLYESTKPYINVSEEHINEVVKDMVKDAENIQSEMILRTVIWTSNAILHIVKVLEKTDGESIPREQVIFEMFQYAKIVSQSPQSDDELVQTSAHLYAHIQEAVDYTCKTLASKKKNDNLNTPKAVQIVGMMASVITDHSEMVEEEIS